MPIGIEIRNAETVGVVPKCTLPTSTCGFRIRATPTTTSSAWVARSAIASRMLSRADSWMPRMFSSAEHDAEPGRDDDLPRQPVAHEAAAGEHREVRRHGVGRDRDRDRVVEHLRPGGEERDGLVEGAARERRRAAGLREARGCLGVGRSREREDHARDRERDRRHPPGVERRDAERVVDRGADVAVGRREHVPDAENGGETTRATAAEQRHALPGELPLAQDILVVEAHEHAERRLPAAVGRPTTSVQVSVPRALLLLVPQWMLRIVSWPLRSGRLGNGSLEAM